MRMEKIKDLNENELVELWQLNQIPEWELNGLDQFHEMIVHQGVVIDGTFLISLAKSFWERIERG